MSDFTPSDWWKAIILYGRNQATYKIALGKVLLGAIRDGTYSELKWEDLATRFFDEYSSRLAANPMPQQLTSGRITTMERIHLSHKAGRMTRTEAISKVGERAFVDVIPRFHTLFGLEKDAPKFYEIDFGNRIVLTDALNDALRTDAASLDAELEARWSLLEGAFSIHQSQAGYLLANDIRSTYLATGYERKTLTNNRPFLQGYQGNVCFYCGEPLLEDVHVDHVLPREVVCHDELWNLVLAHGFCNESKQDRVVGPHFIEKLIQRNENIMGSNHPWRHKIQEQLGPTPKARRSALEHHYENVKTVKGADYWGGSASYNPATDPFYARLITVLNNGRSK